MKAADEKAIKAAEKPSRSRVTHHIQTPELGPKVVRFAGISTAPNHTSQEQLHGWETFVQDLYGHWNTSPAGMRRKADF